MRLTNEHGISLPMAIWLLYDEYDYDPDPKAISATSLLKSTRQLILSKRVLLEDRTIDISAFIASRMGNAVHSAQEKAWGNYRQAMKALRYPDALIERVVINPTEEDFKNKPDLIKVYLEYRNEREINGYRIRGKFDECIEGRPFDTKTTSVYTYLLGRKDDDHRWQVSIYRWINPEIITEDHAYIQYLFTDWQKSMAKIAAAKGKPDEYPQLKIVEDVLPLFSLAETERFIINKINEIEKYQSADEKDIPECTDKELWRSAPKYKYYSNPERAKDPTAKSSKNFDNLLEANTHLNSEGKGVVVTVAGEVKACEYCAGFLACNQRRRWFDDEGNRL
jgi:hypothetical protein